MRALITGGAGFLGAALAERLLAEGHEVEVVDDLSSGSLANLAEARRHRGGFRFHQLDVREPATAELVRRVRPDVAFHLASPPASASGFDHPALDAEVNLAGLCHLLEGARSAGTRKVVFASSWRGYGELEPAELPAREQSPMRPLSPHGAAKKAGVDYLAAYGGRFGIEHTALAFGTLYGPRRVTARDPGVVATFAGALVRGDACTIFGDGGETRDFVYVDDAVDALSRAAERGSGLLVNVGTGRETSVEALLLLMGRLLRVVPLVRRLPRASGEPVRSALDPVRARIHLGWRPWTTLEEGVSGVLRAVGARLEPAPAGR